MLLIYSETLGPRLVYTCTVLFREVSVVPYSLTNSREAYLSYAGPRLNYSRQRITENEVWMVPHGLLWQKGTDVQHIQVSRDLGYPAFFQTGGDVPFDLLASAFFLVSRYEEYLPHETDDFGRYHHRQSLAYREGFLQRPLVNEWMKNFRETLRKRFPGFYLAEPVFRYTPTYDIDIAYAYRFRPPVRALGGAVRDLLQGRSAQLSRRWNTLRGRQADPFDVYEWLDAMHMRYRLRPVYFFLLAARTSAYDRNLDPRHPAMRSLVRYHALGYATGIHPSWQSGDDHAMIDTEMAQLKAITGLTVTNSRQHYLRMRIPDTLRRLEQAGILDDYTMGYGTMNGFRASIATPYTWYDLQEERASALRLHPFGYMDANAMFAEQITPSKAFEQLQGMHNRVKSCGGTFYTIHHNHFLGDYPGYAGWREVYALFLEQVVYWDV